MADLALGDAPLQDRLRRGHQRLEEYDIAHVFIDTNRGMDVSSAPPVRSDDGELKVEDTFTADLGEFWVNKQTPVDIYRLQKGGLELILKKGLTYSEETEELFRSVGIGTVHVPRPQKRLFDEYKSSLADAKEEQKKKGYEGLFEDPERVREYLRIKQDYHAIDPLALSAGERYDFDIFIRYEASAAISLEKGDTLDDGKRGFWIDGRQEVVIRQADRRMYQAYLLGRAGKARDERAQAAIIRENSRILVADLAKDPRSKKLLRKTKKTVIDVSNIVISNPNTFYSLLKIQEYDYDTYTHSVNVAAMSMALASADGLRERRELEALGLGCILHDIGKSRVGLEIINKPGKLTPEEYKAAKHHVMLGYEMIKDNPDIPELAFIPLLQHHEKLNGSGYPHGLSGGQIHAFGRISAIIDIYDALTTRRPYKKSLKPFDALTVISKGIDDYDKNLYRLFVNIMHMQQV